MTDREKCPICDNPKIFEKLRELGLIEVVSGDKGRPILEDTLFRYTKKWRNIAIRALGTPATYRLMETTTCEAKVFCTFLLALSKLPRPPSLKDGFMMAHVLTKISRPEVCERCRRWLTPAPPKEECSYIA